MSMSVYHIWDIDDLESVTCEQTSKSFILEDIVLLVMNLSLLFVMNLK